MRKLLLTISAILTISAVAQTLPEYETQIATLFDKISMSDDTAENFARNDSIVTLFSQALKLENSFSYAFEKLKFVGKVLADDKKICVYTWNFPIENAFRYECIVQSADGKLIRFKQRDTIYFPDEQQKIDINDWYGALYYRAIAYKINRQKCYILIGWNGQNDITQHKFVDVLTFDEKAENAQLGAPIFHEKNGFTRNRLVFEYDSETTMYLDYEPKKRRIAFDHLSPIKYFSDDDTFTLGPDMSIDAYLRRAKFWILKEDIRARNKN